MWASEEIRAAALRKANQTNKEKARNRREAVRQPDNPFIRHISLTRGMVAVVDAFLYEWLVSLNWCAVYNKNTKSFYACRSVTIDGKAYSISMHREIVGLPIAGRYRMVDHKDHDTLNNVGSNLRSTDKYGNGANVRRKRGKNMKGTSPRGNGRYRSYIYHRGLKIDLGTHASELLAHTVHMEAVKKYHGEFAYVGA